MVVDMRGLMKTRALSVSKDCSKKVVNGCWSTYLGDGGASKDLAMVGGCWKNLVDGRRCGDDGS